MNTNLCEKLQDMSLDRRLSLYECIEMYYSTLRNQRHLVNGKLGYELQKIMGQYTHNVEEEFKLNHRELDEFKKLYKDVRETKYYLIDLKIMEHIRNG